MIGGFFQGTEMPDAGWWEALWPDPAGVLRTCGLSAGAFAVDLCAGTGWFTLPMARIARQVVALDIDETLLEAARDRLGDAGLTNCAFVVADAYDMAKVVPAPVDFLFLANVFHGVPDQTRLSRAVAGVLAPGGIFAVVNWHQRPREETTVLGAPRGPKTELRMTSDSVRRAVEPAGLALVRVAELPPYHYGAIFAKARG
jgi:ubiquinone/menaquinone biosynthesis C-methylase UbiE